MKLLNELSPQELNGKKVLYRVDYNLPMKDGVIQDDTRLVKSLSTLRFLIDAGAKIIIMTHLGRPKGEVVNELRLDPIAKALEAYIGFKLKKSDETVGEDTTKLVESMENGDVIMLENLRFQPEEKDNDESFAKELAALGDIYITDAFGVCHRAHASTAGVTKFLPSYVGFLLQREIQILSKVIESPSKPLCLVVGGAKIDTKIGILERFIDLADSFIIGGAMANTFLAAQGVDVGKSLFQEDKLDVARNFLTMATEKSKTVLLPTDLIVADEISKEAMASNVEISEVQERMILDIGEKSTESFCEHISNSAMVLWNGPMGLYEFPQFENGTKRLAMCLAESETMSIIGGGDSIDAINKFKIPHDKFTHISTGGGAMLEFLEGKALPGIQALG